MTLAEKPLRLIAAEYPAALQIFHRFHLDLRRMGHQSLAQACSALSLSAEQVEEKLTGLAADKPAGDPAALSLTQLIQRIVRLHHRRVRQELPLLAQTAKKMEQDHCGTRPHLAPLARLVAELHREMLAHIGREEQVLFPCIALMEQEGRMSYPAEPDSSFKALRTPVTRMLADHAAADGIVEELRQRTNDFETALDACEAKLQLFAGLRIFDEDLAEHLRLENEFLFPRALELETALLAGRR